MRLSFEDEESFKETAESLCFNKPLSDPNTVENSSSLAPSDDPNTLGVMRSSTITTPGEEWGCLKISIIQLAKSSIIVCDLPGSIKSDCPHLRRDTTVPQRLELPRIVSEDDIHLETTAKPARAPRSCIRQRSRRYSYSMSKLKCQWGCQWGCFFFFSLSGCCFQDVLGFFADRIWDVLNLEITVTPSQFAIPKYLQSFTEKVTAQVHKDNLDSDGAMAQKIRRENGRRRFQRAVCLLIISPTTTKTAS